MYVYLINGENRLVIRSSRSENSKHSLLMTSSGGNQNYELELCKMFCLGFISSNGVNVINELNEFV